MTLFDLEQYTEKPKPKPKVRFYVEVRLATGWYAIWKPHTDHNEYIPLSQLGKDRRKPFRWKTHNGARRYAGSHYPEWRVKEWVE